MSAKVYKYKLQSEVALPHGFKIRKVGQQQGELYVWVEVPTNSLVEDRHTLQPFYVYGTGDNIPYSDEITYVDTVFMPSGLVWHIYTEGL